MLGTLAKVCSEFTLVSRRCICHLVQEITNVGLDVGTNQGDNDPTGPGRANIFFGRGYDLENFQCINFFWIWLLGCT